MRSMSEQDILKLVARAKTLPVYPDVRFPPSLYYRFLQAMCEWAQPRVCVELGVCGGGASLHMCVGTSGRVFGVDVANGYPGNIRYVLDHFSNYTFWQRDSITIVDWLHSQGAWTALTGPVDLLFVDTVHTYQQTMAEYRAWAPLLADEAVICLDDLFREGMDRAWDEIPGFKMRLDELHPSQSPTDGGFGLIVHRRL